MQIRAELCHVDTLRCIVRIEAWQDDQLLGSALGEAQTSEEAEQRGLERLMRRINADPPAAAPETAESISAEQTKTEPANTEEAEPAPLKTASPERPGKPSTVERNSQGHSSHSDAWCTLFRRIMLSSRQPWLVFSWDGD